MHDGDDSRQLEPFVALEVKNGGKRTSQFGGGIGSLEGAFDWGGQPGDVRPRPARRQTHN
jgi:hypothetical protein